MPRGTIAELVKYPVPVRLLHLGVNVVAGIAKFGDFLRKQFHTIHRVTEDYALVDLEFGKKSVEAVNLLPFLDVGIELGNTAECEFVHEINAVW